MSEGNKAKVVTSRFPGLYNPYPKGYNARVHGPYDPSRFYGNNPRPSMWDVKLGNLFNHFQTADLTRANLANTFTRFVSRYHARHWRVRKRGFAPLVHLYCITALVGFVKTFGIAQETNGGHKSERRFKYH